MSGETFPRVHSLIASLCESDADLRQQFAQLENALKEKETLSDTRAQLDKDMPNLRLDLMLVRQAADMMHEDRAQIDRIASILETSYARLLQMGSMLDDDRIRNMQRFVVLRKQTEVQEKLGRLDELQRFDLEYKAAMENRAIVQELRKWQNLVREAEQKFSSIEVEFEQMEHQWSLKIRRATEQRNKKIVALAQLRQQLAELELPAGQKTATQVMRAGDHVLGAAAARGRTAPLVLQSALDFLSKYPEEHQVANADCDMDTTMEPPLRSILVLNRTLDSSSETERTISPTKQVHFAPLPAQVDDDSSNMPLDDLIQMVDTKQPNNKHLPERAVIEKVEVLPQLNISGCANASASTAATAHEMSLSFKNLFSASESIEDEDTVDQLKNKESEINDKRQSEDKMQSSEEDGDSMASNDFNTLSFAATSCDANDDFFLNLSDGNSADMAGNGHSYEL